MVQLTLIIDHLRRRSSEKLTVSDATLKKFSKLVIPKVTSIELELDTREIVHPQKLMVELVRYLKTGKPLKSLTSLEYRDLITTGIRLGYSQLVEDYLAILLEKLAPLNDSEFKIALGIDRLSTAEKRELVERYE